MTITNQIGPMIFLFTIFIFNSCGKSEQQIREEKYQVIKQKEQLLKIANDSAIVLLNRKYDAISGWDSLVTYSYELQEMFLDNRKPISFEGLILDIIKSDSTYLLKVLNTDRSYYRDHLALISISNAMLLELNKVIKSRDDLNAGYFIFDAVSIKALSPKIKSKCELDGEDSYSSLDFDFLTTLLIFKGDLIDFHIEETVINDNE